MQRQREKGKREEDGGEETSDADRGRDGESEREERVSDQERERRWGKQKMKNRDGGETDRQGESNYRTPSVFKAPLLSHPSCD